jgi:hypothetical protein
MRSALLFVHLGLGEVDFLRRSLELAHGRNDGVPIVVAISRAHELWGALARLDWISLVAVEDIQERPTYRRLGKNWPVDESFRNGFWRFAIERFFVLEELFRSGDYTSSFHLESDNLALFDVKSLSVVLGGICPGIATTFDADDRCIPGIVYINDPAALSRLNDFLVERLTSSSERTTDMSLLAAFRKSASSETIDALPIVTPDYPGELVNLKGERPSEPGQFRRHIEKLNGIFDAAAIGQYLFGLDRRGRRPRDTRGFINETAVFSPDVYSYFWILGRHGQVGLYCVSPSGGFWPIYSLHVHAKCLNSIEPGYIAVPPNGRVRRWQWALTRRLEPVERRLGHLAAQVMDGVKARLSPSPRRLQIMALKRAQLSDQPDQRSDLQVDVFIAAKLADAAVLPFAIEGVRRNLLHSIGRIAILARPTPVLVDLLARLDCTLIDERTVLPVERERISYRVGEHDRSGWLFQQLLKLGADTLTTKKAYFVIDADTVLVRPQSFAAGQRRLLLHSREHHEAYFRVFRTLTGLEPAVPVSCVAHMMLFDGAWLRQFKDLLETRFSMPWYEAVLAKTERTDASGFSEYESYGQWCLTAHADLVDRAFSFNRSLRRTQLVSAERLTALYGAHYRSVSFHNYR